MHLTTRRFDLNNPELALTAPKASHSIVNRPLAGLYCCKCGERRDFETNCAPAAAEKADAHALKLDKINATAKENEATRAAAHALELDKINATAAAALALELVKIKAMSKRDFWENVTSVLMWCLALAVVSFFSREVAGWVKTTVRQQNSTREWLLGLIGGVVGFGASRIFK